MHGSYRGYFDSNFYRTGIVVTSRALTILPSGNLDPLENTGSTSERGFSERKSAVVMPVTSETKQVSIYLKIVL